MGGLRLAQSWEVPLLGVPAWLPAPVFLLVAASVLAGLDILGAIAAKNWADSRSMLWFVGGAVVFVVLFYFYGSTLQVAELSIVTLGWIVMLQVGVVALDRFRYGVSFSGLQVLAITGILALQGYLVLSFTSAEEDAGPGVEVVEPGAE